MADLRGKWCLITGGAWGIGRAVASVCGAEGAKLVLIDRNASALQQAALELRRAGVDVQTFTCDVATFEDVERVRLALEQSGIVIDVLVNNAGILRTGGALATSLDDYQAIFGVNLMGVIHLTKAFVPSMIERNAGVVVNIASASGLVAFSQLAAYSTSKFAVVGFSEGLRAELVGTGVSVVLVCPGIVNTEIASNSGLPEEEAAEIGRLLKRSGYPRQKAATRIVQAIKSNTGVLHIGADARLVSWAARLAPSRASRWLRSVAMRQDRKVVKQRSSEAAK